MASGTGGTAARSILGASAALLVSSVAAAVFVTSKSNYEDPLSDVVSFISSNSTTPIVPNHPSDHDSLLPLQASDIVGFLCAALGLILAAGGGIGGGGILVPIYVLLFGFLPKQAIPLSNVTVFGGAVANNVWNARRRHPSADRPLIDWDLILVMEPPTLAGALVGAFLNKILPETAITVLLVVLLSWTSYSTLKKARKMYQRETEEMIRQNAGTRTADSTTIVPESKFESDGLNKYFLLDQDTMNGEIRWIEEEVDLAENKEFAGLSLYCVQLSDEDEDCDDGDYYYDAANEEGGGSDQGSPDYGNQASIARILEEEKHPKRRNIFLVGALFCIVLLINILKGGGGFASPLGIECGSAAFWLAQGLLLVWVLAVSWLGRRFLLEDAQRKADAGYVYLDDDLKWDRRSTVIYPLISTLAGFCAGMFGIGGGIIKGPLMIAMGIHPAVASATSACMILFTSFTATTTFSLYGLMVPDYAVAGAVLGFGATFVGQAFMSRLLARSNHNSYIAFSIAFVVLLSAVLMALESVLHLISEEEDEAFGGICDSHLNGHNV